MRRTQIYLEERQYRALRSRARREGKTLAAVIRELLAAALGPVSAGENDPLDDVIGIARGDGSAVAENHAAYLYGDRR